MKPDAVKISFLKQIKSARKRHDSLLPSEGIPLMIEFYSNQRVEGCEAEGTDMLLYQWGTYDLGNGEYFNLDITRQTSEGEDEDDEIKQLSLTFQYRPAKQLRKIGIGNRWCASTEELDEFQRFIIESPAYSAVAQIEPEAVELYFEIAG